MTGLAGGDHLHFGVMAGGRFVDPTEWWDPHWIKDNVLTKLALPEAAPTTAAATQPVPAATASASPAAVSVPPPPSR